MTILILALSFMTIWNIRETHLRLQMQEELRLYRSIATAIEDRGIEIDHEA